MKYVLHWGEKMGWVGMKGCVNGYKVIRKLPEIIFFVKYPDFINTFSYFFLNQIF